MSDMKLKGIYPVNSDLDRIQIIAGIVGDGAKSPRIRQLAAKILRDTGVFGDMANPDYEWKELNAIFNWVKNNISYSGDVRCIDSYHTPERIIDLGIGDCDDFTILIDSLLSSIGWRTGARIVSDSVDKPFHHIYALAVYPKNAPIEKAKLVPLDATIKSFKVGDEVPYAKKKDFLFLCEE